MSSATFSILGTAVIAVLLAGYLAQKYLPPPPPKLLGIDLGTTFSCVGIYHAVSGQVEILQDEHGHFCIPSVVAFRNEEVLTGHAAVAQAERNPHNTIYDAKRFIGKRFTREELGEEQRRYPFKMTLSAEGLVLFNIVHGANVTLVTPETVGAHLLATLRDTAARNLSGVRVPRAVVSVPAEFDEAQRNSTKMAAKLAGLDVWRIINEPTAAALAYGLHQKEGASQVLVIDLGGGTLDVSLLLVQGGMFLTQAMAGNNHLGGQDFNMRVLSRLLNVIRARYDVTLTDAEDLQLLRDSVERAKLNLTQYPECEISVRLSSLRSDTHSSSTHTAQHSTQTTHKPSSQGKDTAPKSSPETVLPNTDSASAAGTTFSDSASSGTTFSYLLTRAEFEALNSDLFAKVLEPISLVLEVTDLSPGDVDEVVLVGGSTRIPRVRELVTRYFGGRAPNTGIDPELAVVIGVAIQAGVMGGAWPLQVSAIEVRTAAVKKIKVT